MRDPGPSLAPGSAGGDPLYLEWQASLSLLPPPSSPSSLLFSAVSVWSCWSDLYWKMWLNFFKASSWNQTTGQEVEPTRARFKGSGVSSELDCFSVLFVLSVFMTGALNAFICIKSYILIFLSNWYYLSPLLSFKHGIAWRCKNLAAYLLLTTLLRNASQQQCKLLENRTSHFTLFVMKSFLPRFRALSNSFILYFGILNHFL